MQVRVAMAQVNATVGDLDGNLSLVRENIGRAEAHGADFVVFPEMVMTGYPPLDLLPPREVRPPAGSRTPDSEEFIRRNKAYVKELANNCRHTTAVVGFVDYDDRNLFNSAAVLHQGSILGIVHKSLLPTYDVFDELRYFTRAVSNKPVHVPVKSSYITLGVSVCEDIWDEEIGYEMKVVDGLAEQGAQMIANLNASPYHDRILDIRLKILRRKAERLHVPIFYVNMVGGQDELVFDGQSLAVDSRARLVGIGRKFEQDLVLVDMEVPNGVAMGPELTEPGYDREAEMFGAVVLGVRDYFRKTGFEKALVALSGGIDSSLVVVIAASALGKENVTAVSMPSRYSSEGSWSDAEALAENLGITMATIPIEPIFASYLEQLKAQFQERPHDITEENLQARIRGNMMMALSNKFGSLVLATGNKTELALGYATLYGDMSGGLEVIGDVSKLEVYALARYYNKKAGKAIIPESCFAKAPSAELRPEQVDPFDYSVISPLVDEIIEARLSRNELIKKGFPEPLVNDTLRRIRNAEYKRRQAAPAIRITKKAFGLGWKMPLVNKFSE